ncbi:MAG: hypothetical protein IIZ28_05800 [Erysipelotrichaceae bacterium]|nr:hypothetical protein [Erysipelotrichaceae bacterium]
MSEKRNGRKRHIVEGTVEKIEKTERSLGHSVGEKKGVMAAIRRFLKGVSGK